MKINNNQVSIAFAAAIVLCSCMMMPSMALGQYTGYFLDGKEIVDYNSDYVTLSNGTTILLDSANITHYLPLITQTSGNQTILSYSNSNYAYSYEQPSNYSAWDPANATRINQGDCVSLGDTIDIAGLGWYTGNIVYYGSYYSEYADDYDANIHAVYKVDARNLSKFYIDPAYFYQYPGWWYIYYSESNTTTSSNDRLFYIGNACNFIQNISSYPQRKLNISELYTIKEHSLSQLPEKGEPGIDFIVSNNLTSSIEAPLDTRVWIFGRSNYKYDIPNPDNSTIFYSNETRNWEPGRYDLVYVKPDGNHLFDERYDAETTTITSPFVITSPLYIGNLQPRIVHDKLISLINSSYQQDFIEHHIEIQDPRIDIAKLDQWQGWDNATLVTMAGYTNANPGDIVTIEMDKGQMGWRESAQRTWVATAWGTMSEYRFWNITFMLDIQNENPGQHNMTLTTNSGGSMIAPFYIYRELPAHYIPENYIQYVNNSPFIPPVIQTVTIPVPGPTQIVVVEVTPSQESVNEAQKVAMSGIVITAIEYLLIAIMGLLVMRYLYRSWRRSKWHKK